MLLQDRQSGLKFVVANTHILFNMKRGDIKTGQVALLIASIDKMCFGLRFDSKFAGVLLCGDFNIEPKSPIYNFIRNGILRYSTFSSTQLALDAHNKARTSEDIDLGVISGGGVSFCVMPSVPLDPNNCEVLGVGASSEWCLWSWGV